MQPSVARRAPHSPLSYHPFGPPGVAAITTTDLQPSGRESAWHRRARATRTQDRVLLQVVGALERLQSHHSAQSGEMSAQAPWSQSSAIFPPWADMVRGYASQVTRTQQEGQLPQGARWQRRQKGQPAWTCLACGTTHQNARMAACRMCGQVRPPWAPDQSGKGQRLGKGKGKGKLGEGKGLEAGPGQKYPKVPKPANVPESLRHLFDQLDHGEDEHMTATVIEETEHAAPVALEETGTEEAQPDLERLETIHASLMDMGMEALAQKTMEDIKKLKEKQKLKTKVPRQKAKALLDEAHKHHVKSKRIVEDRLERVKAVEMHLAEEKASLEKEVNDEQRASAVLKVIMSEYHQLLNGPGENPDAPALPAQPQPQVDVVRLMADLEHQLRTAPITTEDVHSSYAAAAGKAREMGGELTEAQHMWNVMVKNVITAVSGAIYPIIQKPLPDVGVVGGSQGGVSVPATPKAPGSQLIPPSQSSTVPGVASQAERPRNQRETREARSASGSRARSRSRSEG